MSIDTDLNPFQVKWLFFEFFYSSIDEEQMWGNEWGGPVYFSHGTKHSRGVIILVHPSCDIAVKNSIVDKRFIVLET